MIRPYGPGKFNTILDSYVYDVVMEGGGDDEMGSLQDDGVIYTLLKGGLSIFSDKDPMRAKLNTDESLKLSDAAGVIVREGTDGFVHMEYYDTTVSLEESWREAEANLSPGEQE